MHLSSASQGLLGGGCRQHIEAAMEESTAEEKLQREAAAERRRQARTDIKRLQEQEIALLIARSQKLHTILMVSQPFGTDCVFGHGFWLVCLMQRTCRSYAHAYFFGAAIKSVVVLPWLAHIHPCCLSPERNALSLPLMSCWTVTATVTAVDDASVACSCNSCKHLPSAQLTGMRPCEQTPGHLMFLQRST